MGALAEAKPSSPYTDEQRRSAALLYAIKGNQALVGRELDIPETTLSAWRKTEWWDEETKVKWLSAPIWRPRSNHPTKALAKSLGS